MFRGTSLCLPQEKGTSPKSTTTGRRNDQGDPDADGNLARKRTSGAKGTRSEMSFLSVMEKKEPKTMVCKICSLPRPWFETDHNDLYFTERCSLLAPVSICLPIIAEISCNFILGVCLPVKFTSKKIPRNEIQWVNPLFKDHQRVEFCGFVSRDLCLRQHKTKT